MDKAKYFSINGHRVAVFNIDGKVLAVDNECPHFGGL